MSALPKHIWTPESYLEFDRASDIKHEYLTGDIYAMSGGTPNHALIAGNASGVIRQQLKKQPCRVFQSDLRLSVNASRLYTYPDVMVICGELKYADKRRDTVTNPTLIIEVLSSSTERYDRGRKFQHYRTLDTLQDYVLISQDIAQIERYSRQSNDNWLLTSASGLDATLDLPSVGCVLPLADVYEKVEFEEEPEQ